ncbi:MAG TPA: ribosome maturation factor RimM [Pyrinomonadaceae bacterium]|jgi:16S rRNA processing protein RimM|nr:ribosome maturation factor RimM [Pyrinomonadaceae bacterium]
MTSVEDDSKDSLVSVARAVRTRGLKGEIVADLLTDFPERFEGLDRLIAVNQAGERITLDLENFWFQNDRIVLKLAGFDTIEAAQELIGCEFCVPEAERVPLAENEYYDFELEGCVVRDVSGNDIGKVQRVLKTGGAEILEISGSKGAAVMVPLAESIVIEIDTVARRIVIDPPEGLLELS